MKYRAAPAPGVSLTRRSLTGGAEACAPGRGREPLIGLAQAGLSSFEPAFVDELGILMRWGFEHMQAEVGGSPDAATVAIFIHAIPVHPEDLGR